MNKKKRQLKQNCPRISLLFSIVLRHEMLSIWLHSISPLVNQIALINKFQQMGNISSLCKCLITVKAGLVMVSAQISLIPTLINRLESINKNGIDGFSFFALLFFLLGAI